MLAERRVPRRVDAGGPPRSTAGPGHRAGRAGPDPGSNASGEFELDGAPSYKFHTRRFGYEWCDTVGQSGCHVGSIEIVFQIDTHGRRSEGLRQQDDRTLPAC